MAMSRRRVAIMLLLVATKDAKETTTTSLFLFLLFGCRLDLWFLLFVLLGRFLFPLFFLLFLFLVFAATSKEPPTLSSFLLFLFRLFLSGRRSTRRTRWCTKGP